MSAYDRLQIKRREKCQLRSRTSSRAQETRTCKTAHFGTHDGTSFISKFQPTRGKGGEKGREEGWRVGREFDWVTVLGFPPNLRSPCGADQHYRATNPPLLPPLRRDLSRRSWKPSVPSLVVPVPPGGSHHRGFSSSRAGSCARLRSTSTTPETPSPATSPPLAHRRPPPVATMCDGRWPKSGGGPSSDIYYTHTICLRISWSL